MDKQNRLHTMEKMAFCGLELESLRITQEGHICSSPHPQRLGAPLFHPYFTLDYAEAQLEYTTPKFRSNKKALNFLDNLIAYAHHHAQFWPLAMPPKLNGPVNIANFGRSYEAIQKHLYRKGLSHRYGQKTQLICGLHYNFSFEPNLSNEKYLNVMRHFIENTWLLVYLFGASPKCDSTFLDISYPFATSLRMSKHGYHSPYQCSGELDYSNFDAYVETFEHKLKTPCFDSIDEQLNSNILQNESELYTPIRAKGSAWCKNTPLESMKKCGIHYVETRTLDLNPLVPSLVHPLDIDFLQQFLIYCNTLDSQEISPHARSNQHHIALYGREPNVKLLDGRDFKKTALSILSAMPNSKAVTFQKTKIKDVAKTYSHQIAQHDHITFGVQKSQEHHAHYAQLPSDKKIDTTILKSHQEEARASFSLSGYEGLEKSTQCVIREALSRKIDVRILDEKENFIELVKGEKREIIKEATKTAKDTYITPLLMENKQVSKIYLIEKGIETPFGAAFSDLNRAIDGYGQFAAKKMVVKPNTTNFGIGVAFIEPNSPLEYANAVKEGLTFASSVVVEEFISGKEYRFLVMGDQVVGIIERYPAHVQGNGKDTIAKLVRTKNNNPLNYKESKIQIKMSQHERHYLELQNLTFQSIPKKNETIYLRHNCNVSTGGDCIDRTDEIDTRFKQIAVQAAKAADAHLCGVDMVIDKDHYSIIEINFNPMLMSHEFPTYGKSRPVAAHLLDYLGF